MEIVRGKKNFTFLLIGLILFLLLLIVNQLLSKSEAIEEQSILANYQMYENVDELTESAQLVLEATVTGISKNILLSSDLGHTITEVVVNQVMKEDRNKVIEKGQRIEVAEPTFVVEVEGRLVRLSYGDYTPLEEEKKYLLFLHFDDKVGAYYIIGLYQGKYNVDGRDKKEKEILESNEQYKQLRKEVETKYIDQASIR